MRPQHGHYELAAAPTPASVLIIDDDENLSQAVADALEARGHQVTRCADGVEAMEHLTSGHTPDLILLDLIMPRMNGWEFRVEQRRHPLWASIPVVALSGNTSAMAAAIDADAYLAKPIGKEQLLGVIEQTLERAAEKLVEARAAEFERLSSLGVLAAGIAHEVNNPLSFVLANLEVARRECKRLASPASPNGARTQSLESALERAETGARRITSIVRGVSGFARPQQEPWIPMDVTEVVEGSLQLVASELRYRAVVERSYEPVKRVAGNPAKLGQILLNLLINAVHAIPEGAAERNAVRIGVREGPEGQVLISVADTGQGIAPENLARIFERFFSSRPAGQGMGLGLSIVKKLVQELGGTIEVSSELGSGTTFRVSLPAVDAAVETPDVHSEPAFREHTERPRVLVIDDEGMMCDAVEMLLHDEYAVDTSTSARAALDTLCGGESYDVILCDLMMPELTGMDFHAELARQRPDQAGRIIFMTGGTFTTRARNFLDGLGCPHLPKPFRADELVKAVEERLDERGLFASSVQHLN